MNSSKHPLDPLSADEQEAIVKHATIAWSLQGHHLFAMLQLHEPTKAQLASGKKLERTARVTIWDRKRAVVTEGLITTDGLSLEYKEIPGAKSPVSVIESVIALDVVRNDNSVIDALAKRGISDITTVHMETWPIGAQIPKHLDDGRRLIWTPMWHQPTPDANFYAHPIHGLHAIVDIDAEEVVGLEDNAEVPIPQTPGPYRESQTGANLKLKELMIHQPDGASFSVDGWKINWERWNFRIGFDQREGLVIHDVRFNDEGNERTIAHRLSIAELVIPYGDPAQGAYRKNAFDTGEFGLGNFTNSLTLGCDCLGEIVYLDASVTEGDGHVRVIKNAICMHEEDFGILWKHVDVDGHTEVRRGRRFVASSIVTVNNYEYGYFWYFYQDGSIEFEAKLTGIVLTLADTPGKPHPSATELEPGLWAPYHQHILCARMDLDIDGTHNSVVEIESFAHPIGEKNPYGGAYETRETILASEKKAQRLIDPMKSRFWKIINPNKKNHVGQSVGYKLIPGSTTFPLAHEDSVLGKRAGFMYKHLWVTPNESHERYPAGDYPFQHPGGAG
ncbi:MAG: primary-amine oxidase, partial [Actinobacteria bacterium]|nr:primary-amine oxidase [Actinomycetota bacterium]